MAIIENETTNGRTIINRGEYELHIWIMNCEYMRYELQVQILSGLEAKRYKRLTRIIANAGDFTG